MWRKRLWLSWAIKCCDFEGQYVSKLLSKHRIQGQSFFAVSSFLFNFFWLCSWASCWTAVCWVRLFATFCLISLSAREYYIRQKMGLEQLRDGTIPGQVSNPPLLRLELTVAGFVGKISSGWELWWVSWLCYWCQPKGSAPMLYLCCEDGWRRGSASCSVMLTCKLSAVRQTEGMNVLSSQTPWKGINSIKSCLVPEESFFFEHTFKSSPFIWEWYVHFWVRAQTA